MLQQENQTLSANFEWVCLALSATEENCKFSTLCNYPVCGKWLCSAYAEDGACYRGPIEAPEKAKAN